MEKVFTFVTDVRGKRLAINLALVTRAQPSSDDESVLAVFWNGRNEKEKAIFLAGESRQHFINTLNRFSADGMIYDDASAGSVSTAEDSEA